MTSNHSHIATAEAASQRRITAAVDAWRRIVGVEHVVVDGERLALLNDATYPVAGHLLGIVEPVDREQVTRCVAIAAEHRVPLHPVGAGRNWGYGSALPPRGTAVLLSLARLDRIIEIDEELAFVTIEPGVTFRHLAAELAARRSRLEPPMTGGTPDGSVIGTVLERGIGKGAYDEIASRAASLEVVLADGSVIETGLGSFAGALATAVRAEPPGPALQGLFAQSGLGVVTRMTLWLDPAPALRQRLFVGLADAERLASTIDLLRPMLQRSGAGVRAEIINDYRALAQTSGFPADADPEAALPRASIDARAIGIPGRWIACITIDGESAEELELRRRALLAGLGAAGLAAIEEAPAPPVPTLDDDGLRSAYWRKPGGMPHDPHPDRDRCGVIWTAPVMPTLGAVVADAVEATEEILLARGFEPAITLKPAGRATRAVIGIFYDRDHPGSDERAMLCQRALRAELDRRGLIPYRLGAHEMESIERAPHTVRLLRLLKRTLDPHGIISPGRYIA